jgi:hypothetical protein
MKQNYYMPHYKKIHLSPDSKGDDFVELLTVSLAEKLCLQVQAVLEWVSKTKMNADSLAHIHQELHKEGVCGEMASKVLIAVVNDIPLSL